MLPMLNNNPIQDSRSIFKAPKGYEQYANPLLPDYSRDALKAFIQKLSPYTSGSIDTLGQQARGGANIDNFRKSQMSEFQQNIIPQIMQQYGSFGSGRNSGLNNSIASATSQLGDNLATRREGTQQSAIDQLLGLQNQLFNTRPYEFGLQQKPQRTSFFSGSQGNPGGLENIASILKSILPMFF